MKRSFLLFLAAFLLVPAMGSTSAVADELEGAELATTTRMGLVVPREVRSAKRRAARRGEWAYTIAASAAAGYASNIHLSKDDRKDSAVFEGAVRGEVLHYFDKDNRLRIRLDVDSIPHTASSKVDDHEQELTIFYGHEFNRDLKLFVTGKVNHSNDSVTNVAGEKLERDFESWNYQLKPSIGWEPVEDHKFRFKYLGKRKDYVETTDLNSLDWWSHGPEISYEWEVNRDLEVGVEYAFRVQNYDEEPAAEKNGDEFDTNPDEEHFFHYLDGEVEWYVLDAVELEFELGWRHKDDRYRDYESYDAVVAGVKGTFEWARVLFSLGVDYQHREYDNRPDDDTGTLEYDRLTVGAAARHQLTTSLGVFAGYELKWRDTNRSEGTSYLGYTAHRAMVGVSWAM